MERESLKKYDKKTIFPAAKKALLISFVTCLIWVWADLSLDDELPNKTITIIASQANPSLWVTIEGKPDLQIKADLTGPASTLSDLEGRLVSGKEKLEIVFDAEKENMASTGSYKLEDLNKFVVESRKIREYGLGVKMTRPDTLNIEVVELRERSLKVVCVDEAGSEIAGAQITPAVVNMLAPVDLSEAKVKLFTLAEKKQAREGFVDKDPYIELRGGVRYADSSVRIQLPPAQDELKPYTIRGTLGYILSANLVGRKYKIEFTKQPDIGTIPIVATVEAKVAYDERPFEVLLEINDDDFRAGEVTRNVIYNFPEKYVRQDKIQLRGEPAEAKFKIIMIEESENQNQ